MKTYVKLFFALFVVTAIILNNSIAATPSEKKNSEKKMEQNESQKPQYVISVTHGDEKFGDIIIETFPDVAPKHCHNFDSLVAINFYDGTAFHRCIPGFMIQGGDPNSKNKPKDTWGYGDPSQTTVPAEFNDIPHDRGILSTARSQDPNSATSQFFIMVSPNYGLNGQYTVFGKVVSGMDVVDKIVNVPKEGREGSSPVTKVEMKIRKK